MRLMAVDNYLAHMVRVVTYYTYAEASAVVMSIASSRIRASSGEEGSMQLIFCVRLGQFQVHGEGRGANPAVYGKPSEEATYALTPGINIALSESVGSCARTISASLHWHRTEVSAKQCHEF